mmetsp:Transcript_13407/g.36855  ORF Transcript_13407/g.36855 Transcript_13407/m.36855 type:complete len:331 (-) Transcript_13407:312-1304(-)
MGAGNFHEVETSSAPSEEGTQAARRPITSRRQSLDDAVEPPLVNPAPVLPFTHRRDVGPGVLFPWSSCSPCRTCCNEIPAYVAVDTPHMEVCAEGPTGDHVFVNVYDLSEPIRQLNSVSLRLGLGGALHVGVQIADREWSFGVSGVWGSTPKHHPVYLFRQSMDMGQTPCSCLEVSAVIRDMRARWRGDDYDLLTRNCGTFGDALCVALEVGHIPSWVTRLASGSAQMPITRHLANRFCTTRDRPSSCPPLRERKICLDRSADMRMSLPGDVGKAPTKLDSAFFDSEDALAGFTSSEFTLDRPDISADETNMVGKEVSVSLWPVASSSTT